MQGDALSKGASGLVGCTRCGTGNINTCGRGAAQEVDNKQRAGAVQYSSELQAHTNTLATARALTKSCSCTSTPAAGTKRPAVRQEGKVADGSPLKCVLPASPLGGESTVAYAVPLVQP